MSATHLAMPLALLLLSLSACAPARDATADMPAANTPEPPQMSSPQPPSSGSKPPIRDAFSGTCDAKAAQSMVGKALDADIAEQARTAAGARGVRVIRPGQMVTMDHRTGRLNIEVDAAGVITGLRCG